MTLLPWFAQAPVIAFAASSWPAQPVIKLSLRQILIQHQQIACAHSKRRSCVPVSLSWTCADGANFRPPQTKRSSKRPTAGLDRPNTGSANQLCESHYWPAPPLQAGRQKGSSLLQLTRSLGWSSLEGRRQILRPPVVATLSKCQPQHPADRSTACSSNRGAIDARLALGRKENKESGRKLAQFSARGSQLLRLWLSQHNGLNN